MAGAYKQFNENEVLNKALQVFWSKGFEATSMQDLVNNMGINRASMYQTYGNKYALFMASLNLYINTVQQQLEQTLIAPGSPLDNIKNVFQHFISQGLQRNKSGCFINNTAVEMASHDTQVTDTIRNFWLYLEKIINDTIVRAIEKNELSQDTDTKKLATLLNINLQGLVVKTKTGSSEKDLSSVTDLLFSMILK